MKRDRRHRAPRAVVLACGALLLAGCAVREGASTNQLGYQTGAAPARDGLSVWQTVTFFIIIPGVLLVGVAALVWLPGMMRSSRYRPAKGWQARPLWFGGPPQPVAAVEAVRPDELKRGGASGSW